MVTVIEEVNAPVLQDNKPVAVVLNVELPQELTTFTTGVDGFVRGTDVPAPDVLVHPFTVVVTL